MQHFTIFESLVMQKTEITYGMLTHQMHPICAHPISSNAFFRLPSKPSASASASAPYHSHLQEGCKLSCCIPPWVEDLYIEMDMTSRLIYGFLHPVW